MSPSSEQTRRRIDRYELGRELGSGAMGAVYAAYDPKLGREVAIKVLAPAAVSSAKARARFIREAKAVAALQHPNVVQIYDYSGADGDTLYLVMEKLEGQDLWGAMHTHHALPEAIAAAVGHELSAALAQAHAHGIIHRDLKPENVFLTRDGRIVLTDFGIVKAVADDAAVDGYAERTEIIGTPGFMAPEVMRGKALGPAADIFALGVLLYNVATLKMPFAGKGPVATYQAMERGDYVDPRQHQPNLSPAFCAIVARCLAFSPKRRFKSAEALRLALRTVLDGLGVAELRDDCLAYAQDAEAFASHSLRRACKHTLAALRTAAAAGQEDAAQKLAARARVLEPFNEEVERILAGGVQANSPGAAKGSKLAVGLTHLLSGAEWLLTAGESMDRRPTVATPPPMVHGRRRPQRAARLATPLAAAMVLASLVLGGTGLRLMQQKTGDAISAPAVAVAPHLGFVAHAARRPLQRQAEPAARAAALTHAQATAETAADFFRPLAGAATGTGPIAAAATKAAAVADADAATPAAAADDPAAAHLNLAVAAAGRGAWLKVDGASLGFVHATRLQLPAGRHVIELAARGGHRLRRVLRLHKGDERALHVNFTRRRVRGAQRSAKVR